MKAAGVSKNIKKQVQADFNQYVVDLTRNLRNTTPIDTGAAKRKWRQVGQPLDIGRGTPTRKKIIDNQVGYASILDGSEGRPTSRQAPRGIVEPAFKKTRQR
jgi:hypothetical protein|tara:strand:+ start:6576 stop:6881 length:306 start_codon:yes stop_codon:yes gene_type:complete